MLVFAISLSQAQTISKTYNAATRTVTISDAGSPLAEIQLISNTDQCLVECEALLRIKPSVTIQLPPSANNNFKWDFVKASPGQLGLRSYSFEILETVPYTVNNYREVCSTYNITDANSTRTLNNCTTVIDSSSTAYRQEYRPFVFWGHTFEAGKDYYIRLKGTKQAAQGENSVEWVPTFSGLRINEWAWWSSNWTYTRSLSIRNMNNSVVLVEYHPVRVVTNTATLISAGKMRSDCLDARFVYNNATEMDYNVTNCNSASTVFDIQRKGKNITGDANDTSFNFYYGNSAATYTAKNRTDINGTRVLPSTRALLHFNEMTGTTVFDASTYGSNATVNSGTVWNASGAFDGSKTYTAVTDRMTVADHTNVRLEYNKNWTVEFWLWNNDRSSSHVVAKTSPAIIELECGRAGGQDLNCQIKDSSANTVSWNILDILDSKWHHIAIVSNTSADQYQTYVDGRLTNAPTNTHTASIQTSNPWRFGSHDRDPDLAALDTTIDAFRISNDALTTAQMHVLKPEPLTALGAEETEPVVNANETEGDQAIVDGINGALGSNATIYTDQRLSTRNQTGSQAQGTFDRVAVRGNQTWAFNYITTGESATNITSLLRTVNVWENQSLTSSQIRSQVETFINQTKE